MPIRLLIRCTMKCTYVMVFLSLAAAVTAQQLDSKIQIGDHKLHLVCMGKGSPTVVFEAGMGDGGSVWNGVQQKIAETTRACSYDRAGVGSSDPASNLPRGGEAITAELHLLLANAGIPPPYVLVGHSVGGIFVRLFASRYPREVVGMVLLLSSLKHRG